MPASKTSPATFKENLNSYLRRANPLHLSEDYSREVVFAFLLSTSVFIYLSLISFSPLDPSISSYSSPPRVPSNWGGYLGSHIAGFLIYCLGICSFILPIPLPLMSFAYLKRKPLAFASSRILGWTLLTLACATLLVTYIEKIKFSGISFPSSGIAGTTISQFLDSNLGFVGHQVLGITSLISSFILISRKPLIAMAYRKMVESVQSLKLRDIFKRKIPDELPIPDEPHAIENDQEDPKDDLEIKPMPQVETIEAVEDSAPKKTLNLSLFKKKPEPAENIAPPSIEPIDEKNTSRRQSAYSKRISTL